MDQPNAAWRSHVLHTIQTVLERHFNDETLRSRWRGPWVGGEAEAHYSSSFYGKRARFQHAFDSFLSDLVQDADERDVLNRAGHAFELVNQGNETRFNIDIWVISDLLYSLRLRCFSGETHESVASKIGNDIANFIGICPVDIMTVDYDPVKDIKVENDKVYIIVHNQPNENFCVGDKLLLQMAGQSTPVVVRDLLSSGSTDWGGVVVDPLPPHFYTLWSDAVSHFEGFSRLLGANWAVVGAIIRSGLGFKQSSFDLATRVSRRGCLVGSSGFDRRMM